MKLRPYAKSRALVVAIEGGDGVGKATQACSLVNRFTMSGKQAKVVSVPTPDGAYYSEIGVMLVDGRAKTHPDLFQFLQIVNRIDFQAKYLERLLAALDCLVLDRWNASTEVYGRAGGADTSYIKTLVSELIEPDLTVVIDGPCHRAVGRDSFETDDNLQKNVRQLYLDWAERTGARVIDGAPDPLSVGIKVWEEVQGFLGGK